MVGRQYNMKIKVFDTHTDILFDVYTSSLKGDLNRFNISFAATKAILTAAYGRFIPQKSLICFLF